MYSCTRDIAKEKEENTVTPKDTSSYTPAPYVIQYPRIFSNNPIQSPAANPMTVEGVYLGRKLFYDPILSVNGTQACASCHRQEHAFSDSTAFSLGAMGQTGARNSMALFNLGWQEKYSSSGHNFFWDGGASDIESQVFGPIQNPLEMAEKLPNVIARLRAHPEYPMLFKKAFGTDTITSQRLSFAIAQFERTLISGGSKFDRFLAHEPGAELTLEEQNGLQVFTNLNKGDCEHCHPLQSKFFTDFKMHNNGTHNDGDSGYFRITGNYADRGKFKTPSLRNLVYTAPYMHDGRFKTLEQVVEHYNSKAFKGDNVDPFITGDDHATGLNLTAQEKSDLVAFLKTLTDPSFVTNPAFGRP
jgi:cytochrome c peroxidase